MKSPNEFWLRLHDLSEAYLAEGLTPNERTDNIVNQFREMPPIAQREVLGDLIQLAGRLPDLRPAVIAAANEAEAVNRRKRELAG